MIPELRLRMIHLLVNLQEDLPVFGTAQWYTSSGVNHGLVVKASGWMVEGQRPTYCSPSEAELHRCIN